ncbi:hypothetical protein [Legionella sainthelensi]|nr:hypothetical protein [Legionella sainthelensi]
MAIKDAVICFDDIERRGNSLTINEILGYLNFLKETVRSLLSITLKNE